MSMLVIFIFVADSFDKVLRSTAEVAIPLRIDCIVLIVALSLSLNNSARNNVCWYAAA